MKVAKQVFKEFWLPFLIACAWTCYNAYKTDRDVVSMIAKFGSAFFLTSWALSQLYRIRKQQKVDGDLETITKSAQKILSDLEEKTNDLVSHVTGGDSSCYLAVNVERAALIGHTEFNALVHIGSHVLYEVEMRVVDIDKALELEKREGGFVPYVGDQMPQIQTLPPNSAKMLPINLVISPTHTSRSFNIFFHARNGAFTQLLRLRRIDGKWLSATKVERDGVVLFEKTSNDYPRRTDGLIDWEVTV